MRIRKGKKKIAIFFLFSGIIGIMFYLWVPYYMIYHKEMSEKKQIARLKQLQPSNENVRHQENAGIDTRYYQYNLNANNTKRKPYTNKSSDLDHNTSKRKETSKDWQGEWIGDCILIIPEINLEKIVYTGKNREQHLENYELITASPDMKYINGGNYIICGHASRLYGHSLNRLKEVKKGTRIQIRTKEKTDEYVINKVTYENMNQTSQYCKQTPENTLTIISCAKYISKESYIVIYAKKK